MAKILIVGTDTMGIYNHRLELIQALADSGHEVVVAALDGPEKEFILRTGCRFIGTPVENRGMNPFADARLFAVLMKVVKKESPDVVYTFYTKTNIYGGLVARICGVPYIVNVTGLGSAIGKGGMLSRFMMALYRQAVAKAGCIFFQNEFNREFFVKRGIRTDVHRMLPGSGVSLTRYRELPFPEGETVGFLYISRIFREKGIDEYLEAAETIRSRHPDTRFHVVGPCDATEYKLKLSEMERRGIISYHGMTLDSHPFIAQCQCMVYPSYYFEGVANVLLESQASGRPVITTTVPGCRETVDDGVNGFLVPPKDVGSLESAIERFLALPVGSRKAMGQAARRKMEREFDRRRVVDAYLDETAKILIKK